MNEETQEQLNKTMVSALEWVRQAGEFVVAEAPEVVREIVLLGRVENTVEFVLPLLFLAGTLFLWFKFSLPAIQAMSDENDPSIKICVVAAGGSFVGFMVGMVSLIIFFEQGVVGLYAPWFAPRVYVLQELAKMAGV